MTFEKFIQERRDEAKRSILVQVKSRDCVDDLTNYCQSQFGHLKSLQFHENASNPGFENFYIVEFENEDIVKEIVTNHATHRWDKIANFPIFSNFLWMTPNGENNANFKPHNVPVYLPPDVKVMKDKKELVNLLSKSHTVRILESILILNQKIMLNLLSD